MLSKGSRERLRRPFPTSSAEDNLNTYPHTLLPSCTSKLSILSSGILVPAHPHHLNGIAMTSTGVQSTHAHPPIPLMPPTPPILYETPELRSSSQLRMSRLYCKRFFRNGLHLKGLQSETRTTASRIFCPDVRRPCFSDDSPVSHSEVISCWKGLDLNQADEIFTWERSFQKALEAQVSSE